MRKSLLYIFALMVMAGVAFWAYRVNYATQDAKDRVAALNQQIAREREALAVLRAEWAFLNAPDRLRRLATQHQEALGLVALAPASFEDVHRIAYPPRRVLVVADGVEHLVSVLDPVKLGVPEPLPRPGEEGAE